MTSPDPRRGRIEAFNRRLDAHLNADSAGAEARYEQLSAEDSEVLDLALRLKALNPSIESRVRYPLRRRLLAQADRQDRRPERWVDTFLRPVRSWLQPAASLSMTLALIFVFAWVMTGLNFSTGSGRPVTPTAYHLLQTSSLVGDPLPPPDDSVRAGFSPQPIPTPSAPLDTSTGTLTIQNTGLPRQTPEQNAPPSLPVSASPVTP